MAAFLLWHPRLSKPTIHALPPHFIGVMFLHMCVAAPVLEETLYRLLVCVPLAGWRRPWLAIAASGLLFAALHFLYGNPSPENMIGGLILAWAYLKSETIVVPVLLHALGNLLVLAMQVAAWYFSGSGCKVHGLFRRCSPRTASPSPAPVRHAGCGWIVLPKVSERFLKKNSYGDGLTFSRY